VEAGFTEEDAIRVNKDPYLAAQMVAQLHPPKWPTPKWYFDSEWQIKRVEEFLDLHFGQRERERGKVSFDIPAVVPDFTPHTPTEVLLLAVYLPRKGNRGGVQRTFDAWWDFILPPQGYHKWRYEELRSDSGHLQLIAGKHRPGVRWVVYDPFANKDRNPAWCWEDEDLVPALASSEVLMATALFPKLVAGWKFGLHQHSRPNLSGYKCLHGCTWAFAPFISLGENPNGTEMKLGLNYAYENENNSVGWVSPTVRGF
jgi:hypothetical protein